LTVVSETKKQILYHIYSQISNDKKTIHTNPYQINKFKSPRMSRLIIQVSQGSFCTEHSHIHTLTFKKKLIQLPKVCLVFVVWVFFNCWHYLPLPHQPVTICLC